jgi:hypothetical protein
LPLAKSPLIHARLSQADLENGMSVPAFRTAWSEFRQPQDAFVCWGPYALNLLRREEVTLPKHVIDVRKVAGDLLKCRPGSLEALIESRALPYQHLGRGRGGERLGMLAAVTRWLMAEARTSANEQDAEAHGSAPETDSR